MVTLHGSWISWISTLKSGSYILPTPNKKHFQSVLGLAFQFILVVTKRGSKHSKHSKLMFKAQT